MLAWVSMGAGNDQAKGHGKDTDFEKLCTPATITSVYRSEYVPPT